MDNFIKQQSKSNEYYLVPVAQSVRRVRKVTKSANGYGKWTQFMPCQCAVISVNRISRGNVTQRGQVFRCLPFEL